MPEDPEDLADILAKVQGLQTQMANDSSARSVEGSAGGGVVRVKASGDFSFDAITIDPTAVDLNDLSVLEDLVLAAVRDASSQLADQKRQSVSQVMSQALGSLMNFAPPGASE